MRQGGLVLALVAGVAAACLAVGPGLAEDAAGQVEVIPAPSGAYTPADPNMIAVADHGNDRIQVFWPNGTFAFKFGFGFYDRDSRGVDLAVGPDGRIFVLDTGRNYVTVFNPNGSFAFEWGSAGLALGQFNCQPRAIDVGLDGRIVVADGAVHSWCGSPDHTPRIQTFRPNGEFEHILDHSGGYDISWSSQHFPDVSAGPDGLVFVHNRGHSVEAYYSNGSLAANFSAWGWSVSAGPDGRVFMPFGAGAVAVAHPYTDPNGSLAYSMLRPNGTDSNGTVTFVPYVGPRGLPVDRDLAVAVGSDGRLVVASPQNHSVHVFHPNGSLARSFGSFGTLRDGFDSPSDIAVGPDGRIAVAEPGSRSIQVFWPNGSLAAEFGEFGHRDGYFYTPTHVAVAPDGRIVVGDTVKKRVQVFRPNSNSSYVFDDVAFGSHGGSSGFRNLGDIAVDPDGRIVVIDDDQHVRVFHPNGSLVWGIGIGSASGMQGMFSVAAGPDGRIFVSGYSYSDGYWSPSVPIVRTFHPHTLPNGSLAYSPAPPNGTAPNGTVTFGPSVILEGVLNYGRVAVAPDGRIVVGGGNVVQVFRPDGTLAFARSVDIGISSIAVAPDGRIVALDVTRKLVHVFNPDGSFAFSLLPNLSDGAFNGPVAVAVGPMSIPASAGPPAPLIAIIAHTPLVGEGGLPRPLPPHNFTNAGDAANVTINVGGLADPGAPPLNGSESSTVRFPVTETVVAASFATVSFPPNVTAAHVPAGGLLALHVSADVPDDRLVLEALAPNGSGAVVLRRVVEVGGANASVVFDLPVRILLEGQAGGRAFYIAGANGTITPVDAACTADGTAEVHAQLGGLGECQMDSADGGDKIIYTYHLTRFGTAELSQAPVPEPTPTPTPVAPTAVPSNGTDDGGGAPPVAPPEPAPPVAPPEPAPPAPVVHTCSVSLGSANLDLRATAGGYSDPVRQALRNTGSLALERVELGATTWKDVGPLPAPAPAASIPPPVVGTDTGRSSSVLTAVLVAGLLASVTELSTDARGAAPYAPLANGTAVARGLEGGAEELIWFRMNLSDHGGMQGGTFVQTITYQAQCASP